MQPRVATARDIPAIAGTLAGAFHADPVWGWAFPDPSRRHSQHLAFWTLFLEGSIEYEWVWTLPGFEAASLWIPPGLPELGEPHAARLGPLVHDLLGDRAARVLETFEQLDAAHPAPPHYYLSLLGTHPAHAGHGYGMALLGANLAEIDARHMPAYLESSNSVNIGRYESVGFRVHGTLDLPDGGPTVTTMWRDPRE